MTSRFCQSQSGAERAHSKTWRTFEGRWISRERLGVRAHGAAFNSQADGGLR